MEKPGYYQSAAWLLAELERLRDTGTDLYATEVILDGCDCAETWGGAIDEAPWHKGPFSTAIELIRIDHDTVEVT